MALHPRNKVIRSSEAVCFTDVVNVSDRLCMGGMDRMIRITCLYVCFCRGEGCFFFPAGEV